MSESEYHREVAQRAGRQLKRTVRRKRGTADIRSRAVNVARQVEPEYRSVLKPGVRLRFDIAEKSRNGELPFRTIIEPNTTIEADSLEAAEEQLRLNVNRVRGLIEGPVFGYCAVASAETVAPGVTKAEGFEMSDPVTSEFKRLASHVLNIQGAHVFAGGTIERGGRGPGDTREILGYYVADPTINQFLDPAELPDDIDYEQFRDFRDAARENRHLRQVSREGYVILRDFGDLNRIISIYKILIQNDEGASIVASPVEQM